jgi:phosphotransferase system enzyme I (PtsP)
MVRSEYPDIPAQRELYKRVLAQAGERPVVFRTLDVGADKKLPYFQEFDDDNPAMGWRAIRIALDRPAMLRKQLRALLAAAGGRELRIMFPMISEVAEFRRARALLDAEMRRAEAEGLPAPGEVLAGAMLEVPALVWQLPELLREVDFLSVGSNDLMQFLFASDRDNPRLADRYDVLSPPPLRLLRDVVRQADAAGVPVSLCGEMAGRPLEAMALLGLGFRSLSMAPAAMGPVRKMIRSLDLRPLGPYLDRLLGQSEHSLRDKLRAFAVDHGVEL